MTTPTPEYDETAFTPGSIKKMMAEAGASSGDLWMVPPAQLRVVEGFNARNMKSPRFRERVDYLKASIRANGFMRDHPLEGYAGKDGIYVTGGHTRHVAVMELTAQGFIVEKVPVIPKPNGTSLEDLNVAQVTGNTSEPLTPFEVATVCKRLVGMGMDEPEIARRLAYKVEYVRDLLGLLAAPKPIRDMVEVGQVSATLALATIKKHGKEAAAKLKEGLSAAQAKGKTKVTAKTISASVPTPVGKVLDVSCVEGVYHVLVAVQIQDIGQLATGQDVKLAGKKVAS